jgi:hypothetical protein
MSANNSDLTQTFIANTYQKLLQVDNLNGSVGTTAPFDQTVALNTSKYNLLNGLGQSIGGVVIDQTGVSGFNGGLFLKNTSTGANNDGKGSWTLQTSGDGGLNISRNSDDNYLFFLKQSGSAFVGYKNSTIPADVPGYNLYVKDGIYLTSNSTKIATIDTGFEFNYVNSSNTFYKPFEILRYYVDSGDGSSYGIPFNSFTRDLKLPTGHPSGDTYVFSNKYSAFLVGWTIETGDALNEPAHGWMRDGHINCRCVESSGKWQIDWVACGGADANDHFHMRFDIMIVPVGFITDRRGIDQRVW